VCARVVLTDMVFTFFVTATWLSFSMKREKWGFFFSALGALTKGPLGFMIPFMSILTKKDGARFRGVWVFFAVAVPWYAFMAWRFGGDFLYQFFIHENVRRFFVAEHKGLDRIFLYPAGFMGGFFPWSVFLPAALVYGARQALRGRSRTQKTFLFLTLSFWLPFFFFTAAKSKLLSYTFPLYPVLAVLVGSWLARFMRAVAMKFRIRAGFWPWAIAAWGLFPPALVAAAWGYSQKNDPAISAPIIAIGCILVPISWTALVCVWRQAVKAAALILTVMMAGFAVVAFAWLLPAASDLFSSQKWAEWYRAGLEGRPGSILVASKLNVRGMCFYTDEEDMAVVSEKAGRTFYTPHALSILSDEDAFLGIPKKKYPIYGCVRPAPLSSHAHHPLPSQRTVSRSRQEKHPVTSRCRT
jgi:4-amino-4-deoxy-L-arabinose transferase-like glycosyltransferase